MKTFKINGVQIKANNKIEAVKKYKDSKVNDSYLIIKGKLAYNKTSAESIAKQYNLKVEFSFDKKGPRIEDLQYVNKFIGKEYDIDKMLDDCFTRSVANKLSLQIKDSINDSIDVEDTKMNDITGKTAFSVYANNPRKRDEEIRQLQKMFPQAYIGIWGPDEIKIEHHNLQTLRQIYKKVKASWDVNKYTIEGLDSVNDSTNVEDGEKGNIIATLINQIDGHLDGTSKSISKLIDRAEANNAFDVAEKLADAYEGIVKATNALFDAQRLAKKMKDSTDVDVSDAKYAQIVSDTDKQVLKDIDLMLLDARSELTKLLPRLPKRHKDIIKESILDRLTGTEKSLVDIIKIINSESKK